MGWGGGGGREERKILFLFTFPLNILVHKLREGIRTHLTEEREVLAEAGGPDNGVHLGDMLRTREPHPAGHYLQKSKKKEERKNEKKERNKERKNNRLFSQHSTYIYS